ncbi:MAG: PaaI family thioesterase [Myxococcales bacterium]|nr:PaaI family thioesterase [Myxococcales bacterium]
MKEPGTDWVAVPGVASSGGIQLLDELPHGFKVPGEPSDPAWRARRVLAAELRRLGDELMRSQGDAACFERATALVGEARALVEAAPSRSFFQAHQARDTSAHEEWADRSPVIGHGNPAAPPLSLEIEGDEVAGRGTYCELFQGGPGCVHGGHIAAGFDHVLGAAALRRGVVCMTGKLSVKYRKPVRLGVPVEYRARIKDVVGRATLVVGELRQLQGTGHLLAEAEGMFVELALDQMRDLLDRHPQAGEALSSVPNPQTPK